MTLRLLMSITSESLQLARNMNVTRTLPVLSL
jgi:hypothetical protein